MAKVHFINNRIYGQEAAYLSFAGKTEPVLARRILLPLPPSENNRLMMGYNPAAAANTPSMGYRSQFNRHKKRMINTPVYRKFLNEARSLLLKGQFPPIDGPVAVFITFVFPDNRRRDAQNYEKPLFDAFTQSERVYKDDCQIFFHTTEKIVIPGYSLALAFVTRLSDIPDLECRVNHSYMKDLCAEYDAATIVREVANDTNLE